MADQHAFKRRHALDCMLDHRQTKLPYLIYWVIEALTWISARTSFFVGTALLVLLLLVLLVLLLVVLIFLLLS